MVLLLQSGSIFPFSHIICESSIMSSKVIFIVAFLAIVSGIYGVYDALNSKPVTESVVEIIEEQPVRYITLWRAREHVPKGKPLTADAVSREQVPLEQAVQLGVKEDVQLDFDPATLVNTVLEPGQLVFPEHQTRQDQPGYIDLLVRDGMTLYPLQVTTKNLINDFIRPGDFIDILTVSSPAVNLSSQTEKLNRFQGVKASLFLKKVRVMNIGGEALSNNAVSAQAALETDGMTTVVIEVPPTELARLSLAQRTMHIEVYRSHDYANPLKAEVRDVIDNYPGVEELRGSGKTARAGGIF